MAADCRVMFLILLFSAALALTLQADVAAPRAISVRPVAGDATATIQKAFDDCFRAGGGTVTVEEGLYRVSEETKITKLEKKGALPPFTVREKNVVWKVHPFLFSADGCTPVLNDENVDYRLIERSELDAMPTVEKTAYIVDEFLKEI